MLLRCFTVLLLYLKRLRVYVFSCHHVPGTWYRYIPVRVSVACLLCISAGVPIALGKAMYVLALRFCGLLRASSVQAWTLARAARHSLSSA